MSEPIIREFELNGQRFRYRYADSHFLQIQKAKALFQLHNEMVRKGTKSVRDLELSGMIDFETKAMSHLIHRVRLDDTIEPRTKENRDKYRDEMKDVLDQLDGDQYEVFQECVADFFDRAGLTDLESLLQLMALSESAKAAASQQTPAGTASESSVIATSASGASGRSESGGDVS